MFFNLQKFVFLHYKTLNGIVIDEIWKLGLTILDHAVLLLATTPINLPAAP